jgi:cytochrome c-type biogenesis protein CcmH
MRKKWKVESGKWKTFLLSPFSFLLIISLLIHLITFAQEATTALESQVFEIARELRCPVCTSESVGDSSSAVSIEMRNLIQEQLEQGKSKAEILAFFQERYGDWIMLEPPKRGVHLLVWILPIIAGIIGITLLALVLKRWTQKSQQTISVSTEDLERVREEMKWQD